MLVARHILHLILVTVKKLYKHILPFNDQTIVKVIMCMGRWADR